MDKKIATIKTAIVFIAASIVICGCDIDSGDPVSSLFQTTAPDFTILSKVKGMTTFGSPTVTIIIKNTGSAVGYNVSCDIQAKKANTIIDSGFAYFANGGDIDPGEKAQDEAIFFELTSLDGYLLEYTLSWLEHW